MANLSKTAALKRIHAAFAEIPDMQHGFYNVRLRLWEMNQRAEREHRRGRPMQPLSVNNAAKLFTVQHLLDGHAHPDKWTVQHILEIRSEVLYAQAYAKKHHADLNEWAAKWRAPFAKVDYSELMKG